MSDEARGYDAAKDTKSVLIIDLVDMVTELDWRFQNVFKPAPVGLYRHGKLEPVVDWSKPLYYLKPGVGQVQLADDFTDVESDVFDIDGKVVIPAFFMKKKDRFLSTVQTTAYQAIKIAHLMVLRCIEQQVAYGGEGGFYETAIESFFVPKPVKKKGVGANSKTLQVTTVQNASYVWDEGLENTLGTLLAAVSDFIGDDDWAQYTAVLENTSLVLSKGPDIRIVQWHQYLQPKKTKAKTSIKKFKHRIDISCLTRQDIERVDNVLELLSNDKTIEYKISEISNG